MMLQYGTRNNRVDLGIIFLTKYMIYYNPFNFNHLHTL